MNSAEQPGIRLWVLEAGDDCGTCIRGKVSYGTIY